MADYLYFTPCHYIIYENIANFLEIIANQVLYSKNNLCDEEKNSYYVLYPFLLFGTFVFNEIIILNFCGLNHNTKNEIMKRVNIDDINQRNNSSYKIEDDNYKTEIISEDQDEYELYKL